LIIIIDLNLIQYTSSAIIGYFLGCIQASYLIGRFTHNIDIREHGSTNAGASNVTIVLGLKWGFVTFLIDFLKAIIAVLITRFLFPDNTTAIFLSGTFAVLGHIFPVFLGFRGGKGIASLLGMYLAFDWRIGLIIAAIQVIISLITDYVAVGSIVLYLILPVLVYYFGYSTEIIVITILLMILGLYKHYPNIQKIKGGKERGIKSVLPSDNDGSAS